MKKKVLSVICGMMIVGSLCACKDKNTETKTDTITEVKVTTEAATEAPVSNITESQPETDNDTEAPAEVSNILEWPDTVCLVNNKGETTTAYLLADGDYMDRVDMRYKYDGKETWTDTNGVEWSEVVE
ncbi:MAG: hypothetical protein Q4D54_11030 [Eubacteriales bacterium]|nr:hypothetical protein [Lachnospiraceae bacterium]MDO5128254.1 hypothetical protein [Eubacteriales bacterium]